MFNLNLTLYSFVNFIFIKLDLKYSYILHQGGISFGNQLRN